MTEQEPPEIDPVGLYRRYRAALTTISLRGEFLDYGWGKLPSSLPMEWMPYREIFREYADQLANGVNQLTRYVHQLGGWHAALASADDDEKMEALVEFIEPLASTALSLPYAIRSRFFFAISHLCHQANKARLGFGWVDDFPNDDGINRKTAERYGAGWASYPACRDAVDKISRGDFTLDARHSINHRFPKHVLIGLSGMMVRKRDSTPGTVQYAFGGTPALQLDEIAAALAAQCDHCYEAFEAFKTLIREHEEAITRDVAS